MRLRPASGARRDPEGVEVVLIESDPLVELVRRPAVRGHDLAPDPFDDLADLDEPEEPEPPPPRHPRRWYARRLVVALVVLALAIGVPNVVRARSHAAGMARLATLPGFLLPLSGPLTPRWEVPGRLAGEAAGRAVVVDHEQGVLRGVDPGTGDVAWTLDGEAGRRVTDGYCFTLDDRPTASVRGEDPRPVPGLDQVVACFGQPAGLESPVTAPAASVEFVDARTGAPLEPFTVQGSVVLSEPLEQHLLIAWATHDGHLSVARYDPRAAGTVWSYTSSAVVFGTDPLMVESIDRRGPYLVVSTFVADPVALTLDDGREVDVDTALREPVWYETVRLPGGRTATWTGDDGTGRIAAGEVRDPDGTRAYVLRGPVQRPEVWDGSVPGTVVVGSAEDDRIRGVDLETGRHLWSTAVRAQYPQAQVFGVLVVGGPTTTSAVDLQDGSVLWTDERSSQIFNPGLTDGELVLVPASEEGRSLVTARTLRDGEEAWRSLLPVGTSYLTSVGGRLLAQTGSGVVGLS